MSPGHHFRSLSACYVCRSAIQFVLPCTSRPFQYHLSQICVKASSIGVDSFPTDSLSLKELSFPC